MTSPDSIHTRETSKWRKLGSLDDNARPGLWSLSTHNGVSPMQVRCRRKRAWEPKEFQLRQPISCCIRTHQNCSKWRTSLRRTFKQAREPDRQMIHNLDVTFPVLSHPQNQPQVPFLDDDGPSSNCRWSIPSSDIFLIPPHCFSLLSSGFFEAKNPSSQALTLT